MIKEARSISRVRYIKYDGTFESALEISKFLDKQVLFSISFTACPDTKFEEYSGKGCATIIFNNKKEVVFNTYHVVVTESNTVHVMTEEEFKASYEDTK